MTTSRPTAWLRLLRVSNLPTVVSNALTGCALGVPAASQYPWRSFALAAPALILIYVAGMALNDALDAEIDRRERPDRPIPSGGVSRASAIAFAVAANGAALAILAVAGPYALILGAALVTCAVLYDFTHHAHAGTVVLMGACRALAVVTGAAAGGWPLDWARLGPIVTVLGLYVVGLSLFARNEAGNRSRIGLVVVMVCAISLLDAAFLSLLTRWTEALLAGACFLTALAAQRRVIGT